MTESEQSPLQIKIPIRLEKNILYKGKKYPISFSILAQYSNFFFYNRRTIYEDTNDIELLEIPDTSEDAIQNFINCCQNKFFSINDNNVFSIQQLATQYEVPELIKITNDYIKENNENLIFHSIRFKCQNQTNKDDQFCGLEQEEEIIASNLFKYINNEQLLDLPISVLYRILNRSCQKSGKIKSDNQYIEFLFKCLDKYKREASVLFTLVDFEDSEYTLFSRLVDQYSSTFDFSMLNSKYLMKTTSLLLSELCKLKIEFANKIDDMNKLINDQKEIIEKDKSLIKEHEEKFQSFISKYKEDQQKEYEEREKLFDAFKRQTKEEIEKLKFSSKNLGNGKEFVFDGSNYFNGIFHHLIENSSGKVDNVINITASSTYSESYLPQNILIYENDDKHFLTKNFPNSWICFDLKHHHVVPKNYSIRTTRNPCSDDCHPKSWVIEGSNNDGLWTIIDEVKDCTFLKEPSTTHNFLIENQNLGGFQNIRMRLTGKTMTNQNYLAINSFELFGILI